MGLLSGEFAQKLCHIIYEETGCPTIIADQMGLVISATNKEWFHTCQPSAVEVMKNNYQEAVFDSLNAEQPTGSGIFVPVVYNGDPLLSIGILGEPEIVRPLAHIAVRIACVWMEHQDKQNGVKLDNYTLLHNIRDGYYEVDISGNLTFFNSAGREILGYPEQELMGMNYQNYTDTKNAKKLYKHFNNVYYTGEPVKELEVEYIRKDGTKRFIEISISLNKDKWGETIGFRGIARDITERKWAARQLEESEQRYKSLFENNPDAVFSLDLKGRCLSVNPAVETITGYTPEEVINQKVISVMVPPEHHREVLDYYKMVLNGECQNAEITLQHKKGHLVDTNIIGFPMMVNQKIEGIYFIAKDITESKKASKTIHHLAYHDDLTGMPNRRMLQNQLEEELNKAKKHKKLLAVLFLDLDRFKVINDSLGHAFGDLVLTAVSKRLTECTRRNGIVGRMGGDEFAVILPEIDLVDDVIHMVRQITETLNKPLIIQGNEFHITSSIGIALYPEDGQNVANLMKHADTAMYRAKEQGKNNFKFYRTEKDAWASQRLKMESELRKALYNEEFELHYQPQVEMKSGKIIGMEALVRWQHPIWGTVPPHKFIPLAEETGLIIPLDEWVLKTACLQNKDWQNKGFPPLTVSVNLSMLQFQQKNLSQTISKILSETGLNPKYLELELTESMIMNNSEDALHILQNFKKMGIKISLDDFGTGYSSLSHLKNFPIDTLKIDQSFIRNITSNPNDLAIVKAIIRLAHSLKLRVIAEGVEEEKQSQLLLKWGCDIKQGFLFSPPVSEEILENLLLKA